MQKKKQIKEIILITIIVILLLLIMFAEDIIKLQNNKLNEMPNIAKAQYTTTIGENIFDITNAVTDTPNAPTISAGMIPIKWDGNYWTITTKDDNSWYNYANNQPAYIMLNDGTYQSELIRNMEGKKLAEQNIGAQIQEDELGTICMWLPRFAYNEQGEILHIKQGYSVAGTWTMPEIFTYETEQKDISLAGVWIEYNPLSSTSEVTTKINNMNKEESIYGFIANTKPIAITENDITTIQKYTHINTLENITNKNRTILKITNSSQLEPIKAKAYYDETEEKIKIEVIDKTNEIVKILDENGNILSENSTTADTGEEVIGNKVYKYIIIDNIGNQKEIIVAVTGLDVYIIANEEDLKLFRDAVNHNKTTAKTIAYQIADVKLNEGNYTIDEETKEIVFNEETAEQWEAIGSGNYYYGKYYGNNHTISGLYGRYGLFGYCDGVQIQGVGIIESYMELYSDRGGIVQYAKGNTVLENCYSEANIKCDGNKIGGLVGKTLNDSSTVQLTMNGCYNKGKIITERHSNIGGLVGYAYNADISNCYNSGNIVCEGSAGNSDSYTGGIVAYMAYGSITNCYNIADVSCGGRYAGGICGYYDDRNKSISNCYNYGNVSGYGRVGGIAGICKIINNCYNYGNITGKSDDVGGIAGRIVMNSSNLYNFGNIYTEDNYVGGICGYLSSSNLTLAYNTGKVNGDSYIGGIVGELRDANIQYLYNMGNITGSRRIGGIVGNLSSLGIQQSYNIGNVLGTKEEIGGIVGSSYGRIYNNYSDCNIEGSSYVGGIIGYNQNASISGNYYKTGTATNGIGSSNSESGTAPLDEMPTIISVINNEEGFIEDTYNINNGYPILAWQTDNDKLNLINGDNAFVEDTEGINNGYPILAWQIED